MLQGREIVLHAEALLGVVVWVRALHLRMEMTGLSVWRRIEQRRRRQRRLAVIVGSAMRLVKVKSRRFLGERQEIVLLRLMLLMGMQRPIEVLEIFFPHRMPPGLLQVEMLLQLLPTELLRVVRGLRWESDRRVRGQMRMRRVQRR